MPRAFDRRIPRDDHNPLRGLLDFTSVDSTVQDAGGAVNAQLELVRKFAEQLVREIVQRLLGLALDPEQAIEDLLAELPDWVANLPGLAQLVEAITGSTGGLPDLESFFSDIVPLDQLIDAITGSPGDLPDLVNWVNDLPILSQLVGALTGSTGGLLDLQAWSNGLTPLNAFEDLLDGLGGSFGSDLGAVIDRLNDFLTPDSDIPGGNIIGAIDDDVVPGIGNILNGIFGAITGHQATSTSQSAAQQQLAAQNAALQHVAAQVALLNTAFTSGVSAGDDYERTDTDDMGTNWDVRYSTGPGNVFLDGHNAAWNPGLLTAATRTMRARYTGTNATSSTDYQRVEIILNSAPQSPLIGVPAANDILLRIDSGFTNFIRIRFRGDGICLIYRVVSGVETLMNSQSMPFAMVGGTSLVGEAGKYGTARYFRGLINGSPACEVTEAGTASMVGSSYRGWGLGMFAGSKTDLIIVPAQALPGSLKQWTAADLAVAA